MKTFKDLIEYYKICKDDECVFRIKNNRNNCVEFDFVKDNLRIFYTRKIVKINLLSNKVECVGQTIKSNKFPPIEIKFESMCVKCHSIYNSKHRKLNEKNIH